MYAIAIDDEPLALEIIRTYCKRMGNVRLETFSNPLEGMRTLLSTPPDVLFLDIEMNGISGLDLARRLPPSVCLVLTTAYAQFALEGFELNAVDYLHKPFSFARFSTAMQKVSDRLMLQRQKRDETEDVLTVKVEYRNVPIRVANIGYVEAMENYVRIHMLDGAVVTTQMNMKKLLESLQGGFVRVHKSYVVALRHIIGFSRKTVNVGGCNTVFRSVTLPIGRAYADTFLKIMLSAENTAVD